MVIANIPGAVDLTLLSAFGKCKGLTLFRKEYQATSGYSHPLQYLSSSLSL